MFKKNNRGDNDCSETKKLKDIWVLVSVIAFVLVVWVAWPHMSSWYLLGVSERPTIPSNTSLQQDGSVGLLGQFGDAFGGLNALFTALAFAVIFWSGFLQRRDLNATLKMQERQHKSLSRQAFEATFFKLLQLSRDITDGIKSAEGNRVGARELDSWAEGLRFSETIVGVIQQSDLVSQEGRLDVLVSAAVVYEEQIYRKHASALGPYFRSLFQTFKYIDEVPSELLGAEEKAIYLNIARGQISDSAVLLLAMNGLTVKGEQFVKYIEQYGLLEHMHAEHLALFREPLGVFYRSTAFLGSKERVVFPSAERSVPHAQIRGRIEAIRPVIKSM